MQSLLPFFIIKKYYFTNLVKLRNQSNIFLIIELCLLNLLDLLTISYIPNVFISVKTWKYNYRINKQ